MAGEFAPDVLLGTLVAHGVDFVVIGGIAATLLGSAHETYDLDVCPAQDEANLAALGRALEELGARLRGVEDDVPFVPDGATLARVSLLTLDTDLGPLDVLMRPDGCPPYSQLKRRAERMDVGPAVVLVSSLEDLVEMKRAAGRGKDREDVQELEAIKRLRRRVQP